ncbi:hypothetical protein K440DRAFT_239844 [Wilcoxina mikolae CBS 423.85]|nr:hypothetical protein K440DRAFT_239844 [Wilcoxina mikolae CBS 423.85]
MLRGENPKYPPINIQLMPGISDRKCGDVNPQYLAFLDQILKPLVVRVVVRLHLIDHWDVAFQAGVVHKSRSSRQSDDVLLLMCNKSLASLGIILVELWFGKRLEDLPGYPKGLSGNDRTICSGFIAASQLLETIQNEAGDMYAGVVRRCIRGIDHRDTSLEDESFMNEVHAKVVSELERIGRHISAKTN